MTSAFFSSTTSTLIFGNLSNGFESRTGAVVENGTSSHPSFLACLSLCTRTHIAETGLKENNMATPQCFHTPLHTGSCSLVSEHRLAAASKLSSQFTSWTNQNCAGWYRIKTSRILVRRTLRSQYSIRLHKNFEVLVGRGPEQQLFPVFYDVVVPRSEFFRAARSDRWTKADVPTLLEEENPVTFADYMSYVYFAHRERDRPHDNMELGLIIEASKASVAELEHSQLGTPECPQIQCARDRGFKDLIATYVLADKLMDPTTANMVIDDIIWFGEETLTVPTVEPINLAYDSTLPGSPLRKLIRDLYIHEALHNSVETTMQSDPHPDFLVDFAIESNKLKWDGISRMVKTVLNHGVAAQPKGHYHLVVDKPPMLPAEFAAQQRAL